MNSEKQIGDVSLQREAAGDGEVARCAQALLAEVQHADAIGELPDEIRGDTMFALSRALSAPLPTGTEPNREHVICPACCHQFRAIPEQVQALLLASGHEPPFTTPASAEPVMRVSRDVVRTEITREDFGPAGEAGDRNYQRWLDQTNASTVSSQVPSDARGGGEAFGYYIETLPPKAWESTFTRAPELAAMHEAAASGRVKVTSLYSHPTPAALDAERLDWLSQSHNIRNETVLNGYGKLRDRIDAARATTGADGNG